MERKIGEIFEHEGVWYQCIEGCGCDECTFHNIPCDALRDIRGECMTSLRSDTKEVYFKKLKKLEEPLQLEGMFFQKYVLKIENYVYKGVRRLFVINAFNKIIYIEIKQNQENMGENKLNLKPFDLEKAKLGKHVCTRDGRKARIICFDRDWDMHLVALVSDPLGESVHYYLSNGKVDFDKQNDEDLMMLPEKKEGWVNIYQKEQNRFVKGIFPSKDKAIEAISEVGKKYIDTIKISWEE